MKWLFAFLAVLFMVAPAMADVTMNLTESPYSLSGLGFTTGPSGIASGSGETETVNYISGTFADPLNQLPLGVTTTYWVAFRESDGTLSDVLRINLTTTSHLSTAVTTIGTNGTTPSTFWSGGNIPTSGLPGTYNFTVTEDATGLGHQDFGNITALDVDIHSPAPVPIPAAIWLLGSGLVGLAGIRRRFKK